MRGFLTILLLSGMALAQTADAPKPADAPASAAPAAATPGPGASTGDSDLQKPVALSIEILGDTGGANFGPYLESVLKAVRENLIRTMPAAVQEKKGEVSIGFSIARDGTVSGMRIADGSGDNELDHAAWAGIVSSNPLPPLPDEFPAEFLQLRIHFRYHPERSNPAKGDARATAAANPNVLTIPAGTKIPLSLAQAISTRNARDGDAVYATTAFPFVVDNRVVIPAGAYIQGIISHVERAGHGHGRAEILMHFTSIIYPSGYTVMLPGSVEKTPGADNKSVKDEEGTIQQDKDTGKKIEDAARNGTYGTIGGATAGGLAGGLNGARVGAGVGAAAGIAWALLKRGPDVKLEVGTSIEMQIQRAITVDAGRIAVVKGS